jgi:Ca-activated chloride channel family protein
MRVTTTNLISTLAPLFVTIAAAATAQPDREDETSLEEITVTGSFRVTAGGAKDINFARAEIDNGRIPHPDALTVEGLLSEHDLLLPTDDACRQLFCLTAEAMGANLPTLPNARYLVGLGFSSNVDPKNWRREPVNVVAVVDKSGSMHGEPLALVRRSLRNLVGAMHKGDQLSIVLYGDRSHVHLRPTAVTPATRDSLLSAIDAIESAGSTNMEAGLQVGFALARESQAPYTGVTRVVLFTDERPNVGRTDATSFSGMARSASEQGIGMTTIGVGVQFDTQLATALSSTRGGNLFFLDSPEAADTIFDAELDYMVSELAHDVEIRLRPDVTYRIAGVYGVPGELLGWQDETSVTVRVPTVFLSQRGGGIFVSLAPAEGLRDLPARASAPGAPLMAANVSYLPAHATIAEGSTIVVEHPHAAPSEPMALGGLLIDQFLSLRAATTAHHVKNDQQSAYEILHGLNTRLESVADPKLAKRLTEERGLVATLTDRMAFLSGHAAESRDYHGASLWGDWAVVAVRGDSALCHPGDVLTFTVNNELVISSPAKNAADGAQPRTYTEDSRVDYWATKREVLVPDEELVARYSGSHDTLTLRIKGNQYWDDTTIELTKLTDSVVRE